MAEEKNLTKENVMEALRTVEDPELHLDVVALGLIRDIDLESQPAHLKMVLTTPFCPYGPWMVQQIKDAAEAAVGASVKVEVLAEQWSPDMMEDPSIFGFM